MSFHSVVPYLVLLPSGPLTTRGRCRSLWTTCLRPCSAQPTVAPRCRWPSNTCLTSWTNRPTSDRSATQTSDTPGRATGGRNQNDVEENREQTDWLTVLCVCAAFLSGSGSTSSRIRSLSSTSTKAASLTLVCPSSLRPLWTPARHLSTGSAKTLRRTSCFTQKTSPTTRAGWRGS